MLSFVWAQDEQGIIGQAGHLPWQLPHDLQHFKDKTLHKIIVMGHTTYQSFPQGPLPQRENWILTHQSPQLFPENVLIFDSTENLLAAVKTAKQDVAIIGGESVFSLFADDVEVLEQTIVHTQAKGDVLMPALPWSKFKLVSQEYYSANQANPYAHTFLTYEKK